MAITVTFRFRRGQKVRKETIGGQGPEERVLCLCNTGDGNYYTLSSDKDHWVDEADLTASSTPSNPPQGA